MRAKATIKFVVPVGYEPGDYARLHGNGGSGDIDFDNPLTDRILDLFPNGAGIYGFGLTAFSRHRFGKAQAMRTQGFGQLPFGYAPFGFGTNVIEATDEINECGAYKYALVCYDQAGNEDNGDPEQATLHIHIAPDYPDQMKKYSYNKTTGVLILAAAS